EYRDTLIKGIVGIESNNPISVGDYSHDYYYLDPKPQMDTGSGFFTMLPPLEQGYNDGSFFLVSDTTTSMPGFGLEDIRFKHHYVQVTADSSVKSQVSIDGSLVNPVLFKDVPVALGGNKYVLATIE